MSMRIQVSEMVGIVEGHSILVAVAIQVTRVAPVLADGVIQEAVVMPALILVGGGVIVKMSVFRYHHRLRLVTVLEASSPSQEMAVYRAVDASGPGRRSGPKVHIKEKPLMLTVRRVR